MIPSLVRKNNILAKKGECILQKFRDDNKLPGENCCQKHTYSISSRNCYEYYFHLVVHFHSLG